MVQGYHKLKPTADSRLPITPTILKKLVESRSQTVTSHFHRIMFKSMYLLAFHAFMRVGEITSTGTKSQHYLKVKDIVVNKGTVEVNITHFKNSIDVTYTLEISHNPNNPEICPVLALHQYLSIRKHDNSEHPLFSFMDGTPIRDFSGQLRYDNQRSLEKSLLGDSTRFLIFV